MHELEFDQLPDKLKRENSVAFTRHKSIKKPDQADTSDEEGIDTVQQKEMLKAKEEQKVAEELCLELYNSETQTTENEPQSQP